MAETSKYFLLFLREANKKQLRFLLQYTSKAQVLSLKEVPINLLQGKVPVNKELKTNCDAIKFFTGNWMPIELAGVNWHEITIPLNILLKQL